MKLPEGKVLHGIIWGLIDHVERLCEIDWRNNADQLTAQVLAMMNDGFGLNAFDQPFSDYHVLLERLKKLGVKIPADLIPGFAKAWL